MSFDSRVGTSNYYSGTFTELGFAASRRQQLPSLLVLPASKRRVDRIAKSPVKRAIDLIVAAIGLFVTGLLLIPIAIAIKIDSPGPIFFSQTRVGLNGKRFRIWKFRSMVIGADALKNKVENKAKGCFFKNENDPRITAVGAFLRKTSLDEFPQFWNVLRGEMSAVGTRPPTVDEVAQYQPYHWKRLNVKPGITGEWQVKGRSNVRDFDEVVAMDLNYQRNWSISYDLKLIFKTLVVVFNKEGAY